MNLPSLSVRRPVAVLMGLLALLLFGLWSLPRLDIDLLPRIDPPAISVITYYPGANARDVESNVTKVIEDRLSIVSNLDRITSISKDSLSVVTCTFKWGSDLGEAANDVREKLDIAKFYLPKDIENPLLFKFSSANFPILFLSVEATESYRALYQIVDKQIATVLKRIPGVGAVIIRGGLEREIRVEVDNDRLAAYGLSLDDLGQALKRENLDMPAGEVKIGKRAVPVRVPGRFRSPRELAAVPVAVRRGRVVRLGDVARVDDAFKDKYEEIFTNGRTGILLMIQKQSGANTVNVVREIRRRLPEIERNLPADVKLGTIMDSAEDIENMVNNLKSSLYLGGLLVVVVTFVFLRRLRPSLVVALTIPFSMIVTFFAMYLFGFTLNLISIMSLTIAIGMVVDNAIVVLENITRHLEEGEASPARAAVDGASEVGLAVSASTLTTIAVFLPLVFLGGIAGILFKQLGFLVTLTLLASLLVSLTLTPMAASKLLKPQAGRRGLTGALFRATEAVLDGLERAYAGLLGWMLRHRAATLVVAAGVLALGVGAARRTGSEFMPQTDTGEIEVNAELPVDVRIEEATRVVERLMKIFYEEVPEVRALYALTGQSRQGIATAVGFEEGNQVVRIGAKLVDRSERQRSVTEIAEALRRRYRQVPDIEKLSVRTVGAAQKIFFGAGAKPLVVEVLGNDWERLRSTAGTILEKMRRVPGVRDASWSLKPVKTEWLVEVDREKAGRLGLPLAVLARDVRTAVFGTDYTQFRDAGDDYDITVRLRPQDRAGRAELEDLRLKTLTGRMVRLKDVARITEGEIPLQIDRKNQQRMISVSADVVGRSLGEVTADLEKVLAGMDLPEGITVRFGGDVKEKADAFRDLLQLLALGMVLVFMVMAAQFESLVVPFVIFFSVPFALTGAFLGLAATGTPLSLMSFIGIIMLVGIVVNNAIVLVDYAIQLRARGLELKEALLRAGRTRLRPVLMTTLTTAFGMLPMALSRQTGHEMWNPLGIAVIGGLLVSTLVTLGIVPVMGSLLMGRAKVREAAG
ncbi:efflux RND transporter permease subunit [Deferrisoma camini]|uniref:efflux RND transporter permease subunit n=1 Tax=Deferrisoma camini TaxID=1035120 RepID=UPI00046CB563|nr:efflux RND transporter permease subunit [Deferrisoma camini]